MSIVGLCKVVCEPKHTRNLFGPVSIVAGKTLRVIERNASGDCLALLPDNSNLIDVDGRDIEAYQAMPSASSLLAEMLRRARR